MPKKKNKVNNFHLTDRKLVEMLEEKGIRPTETRKIILRELSNSDHPDANEIYLHIRAKETRKETQRTHISIGTVYRNLNLFKEKGLIYELEHVGGVPGRFEIGSPDHSHFICEKCWKIFDIKDQINKTVEQELSRKLGVMVTHHQAEFYGFCKECGSGIGK